MSWIACALLVLGAELNAGDRADPIPVSEHSHVRGHRTFAASDNFEVTCRCPGHDARQIAECCERWRSHLHQYWYVGGREKWTPRCQIVIHANQANYLAAVGSGASQTFGSSWVEFTRDKQVSRRQIDFRGDHEHGLAAVPHELTHVILADLLGGRQPPRWADEGMAILADSRHKQTLHERDLTSGLAHQTAFRAVELLALDGYPPAARVPAFYGQSASLTAFLVARDEPATFVKFLQASASQGYDAALRDCYGIDSVRELERLWHEHRASDEVRSPILRLALDASAASIFDAARSE